jgi:hypothetical protein
MRAAARTRARVPVASTVNEAVPSGALRVSWKPKRPKFTLMTYPAIVARRKPAAAITARNRREATTLRARIKAVTPWSRKRGPMVGIRW